MLSTQSRARVLALVLVPAVNGYAALMLYTFLAAPRTVAHVTDCTYGSVSTCHGTWRGPDGAAGNGRIKDARSGDRGTDVTIRLGPLGAYKDTSYGLWVHLFLPIPIDIGMLGMAAYVAGRKRTMKAEAEQLLIAPAAAPLLVLRSGQARHPDGSDFLRLRSGDVYDTADQRTFTVDTRDIGSGEPRLAVGDAAGIPIGEVVRGRMDRPVSEPLRTLTLALGLDLDRLLTTRMTRRSSVDLGKGFGGQ